MAKTKSQKKQIVADLAEKIAASDAVFFIEPKSVNPNESAELKIKLQELDANLHLVKNSLFKIALNDSGLDFGDYVFEGHHAVVFAGENSPEAAKIIKEFIKATEKAEFKGGFLNKKLLSGSDVKALADLPSREQLIAQVIGTMNAPISGFVTVLAGNVRSIVNVVDAIRKQKEETGA